MYKNSNLFEKIKKARLLAGLSQKDLAQKLGVSDKTISAYEMGRAIPPVLALQKIAEVTKQPLEYFFKQEKLNEFNQQTIERKLDIIIDELKKISKKLWRLSLKKTSPIYF